MTTEATTTAEASAEAGAAVRASGIVFMAGGRVLLLKRGQDGAHPGTWAPPGGKIEEGETPEQAAMRESLEEVGCEPSGELKTIGEYEGFAAYLCECEPFGPVLCDESDGYVWTSPDDLPQPLHPHVDEQIKAALELIGNSAAQDASAMDESARQFDTNGWYEVKKNPLSLVGVFPYMGRQISKDLDPDKVFMVYRPAEELNSEECKASFRLLPWIDNHVMLGDEAAGLMPAERKGIQGVIGEQIYFDPKAFQAGGLFGNVKVFSQSLANLIETGKRELSCGYRCKYVYAPGSFMGQPYDYVQTQMRGNHLALVDSGRMGSEVAVLDGLALDHMTFTIDSKEIDMAEETTEGGSTSMSLEDAVKAVSALLPAIKMITEAAAAGSAGGVTGVAAGAVDAEADAKKAEEEAAPKAKADEEGKKKEGEGMDAAAQAKLIDQRVKESLASMARRDVLAAQGSKLVGTFDHSDMTEQGVASYLCKKWGVTVPAGHEVAAAHAYLIAKPAATAVVTTAQDASTGGFVDTYLTKGA